MKTSIKSRISFRFLLRLRKNKSKQRAREGTKGIEGKRERKGEEKANELARRRREKKEEEVTLGSGWRSFVSVPVSFSFQKNK